MTYVRKPHKKAKTGCTSCKRRRIKCDESKPFCERCKKRKLQCVYLPIPQPKSSTSNKEKTGKSVTTTMYQTGTFNSIGQHQHDSSINTSLTIPLHLKGLHETIPNTPASASVLFKQSYPDVGTYKSHLEHSAPIQIPEQQMYRPQSPYRQMEYPSQYQQISPLQLQSYQQSYASYPTTASHTTGGPYYHMLPQTQLPQTLASYNPQQLQQQQQQQQQQPQQHFHHPYQQIYHPQPPQQYVDAPTYTFVEPTYLQHSSSQVPSEQHSLSAPHSQQCMNTPTMSLPSQQQQLPRFQLTQNYDARSTKPPIDGTSKTLLSFTKTTPVATIPKQTSTFTSRSPQPSNAINCEVAFKQEKVVEPSTENRTKMTSKYQSPGEQLSLQVHQNCQREMEPTNARDSIHLPLSKIAPPLNSAEVNQFFNNVKKVQNLEHSPSINEDIGRIFNPMFITSSFDLSQLSNSHINNQFLSYACYMELSMKIQQYTRNSLPFRISKDKLCVKLIMVSLESTPLSESLYHVFCALSYISLYHENVNNQGTGDCILKFDAETYLTLSDYHLSRSIQSLSMEVNQPEAKHRAWCLYMTNILQIICTIWQPTQKICSPNFLMIYKNMEFIGDVFQDHFQGCSVFNGMQKRALLVDYSKAAEVYAPVFLSGLEDVEYHEDDGSKGESVKPLNDAQRGDISMMIERLYMIYRGLRNQTGLDIKKEGADFVDGVTGGSAENDWCTGGDGTDTDEMGDDENLEKEFFFIVQRLFYQVPESFIDLVSIEDPRALIIVGYAIMLLASTSALVIDNQHYKGEIDFILRRMDRLQNGNRWKAWLEPVVVSLG